MGIGRCSGVYCNPDRDDSGLDYGGISRDRKKGVRLRYFLDVELIAWWWGMEK